MSYSNNLLDMNPQLQYPVNYGGSVAQSVPQAATYAITAANNVDNGEEGPSLLGFAAESVFAGACTAMSLRSYAKNSGQTISSILKAAPAVTKGNVSTMVNIAKGTNKVANFQNFYKTQKTASDAIQVVMNGSKATTTATKVAQTASKASKFARVGQVAYVGLECLSEATTNVIPTFSQLGTEAGLKQTAKSAVKVAGVVGGYAAGAKLGAVIGTCVGGPVGTAIGAGAGLLLGSLCSWIGGKVAKKVTGKSELEKAAEKQKEEQAAQAKTVSNQQLMQQAGISPVSTVASNPMYSNNNNINPFLSMYSSTEDLSNNLLMAPLVSNLRITA
jgi:hypothetical protein